MPTEILEAVARALGNPALYIGTGWLVISAKVYGSQKSDRAIALTNQLLPRVNRLLSILEPTSNNRIMQIEHIPAYYRSPLSSNYTKGRYVIYKPQYIVLHWMAGPIGSAINRFISPTGGTSAHKLFGNGRVVQMVSNSDAAYHCGKFFPWQKPWHGRPEACCNLNSIGYEIQGGPGIPFQQIDIENAIECAANDCREFNIVPSRATFKLHKEVGMKPTSCSEVPIDYIIEQVKLRLNPPVSQPIRIPVQVEQPAPAPAPVPAPAPQPQRVRVEPSLVPGQTSDEVKKLQQRLKDLGHFPADQKTTTFYGNITAKAVLAFQKKAGVMPENASWRNMEYVKDAKGKTVIKYNNSHTGAGFYGPTTADKLNNA